MLHKDSYYNKENKSDITDVIVAKNNDEALDTIKLVWMPEYCMFGNTIIIEENLLLYKDVNFTRNK
ncbi:MAG: hypothetical protein IKG14_00145 [Clostridia bacterium]|nr:hypothetical protein [Clostridia bacterium]